MTSDSQIELNKNNNTIVVILVPHVLSDKMLHPSAAYSVFFSSFFLSFYYPLTHGGARGSKGTGGSESVGGYYESDGDHFSYVT